MRRLTLLLATGLGLGCSPLASGTVGSLLGLILVVGMAPLTWKWQLAVSVILVLAAIPICDYAEDQFGHKDDGRIVADEYMVFPLGLVGLPCLEHPWLLGVGFVTIRLLDIIKPPPAQQLQAAQGGLGIVLDDVMSTLYALLLNHAVFYAYLRFMMRQG